MKGIIYKGIGGFYYVRNADGEEIECKARGRFRKERVTPMIGDEVEVEVKNGKGAITEIMPRRTKLIRPPVANIDMVVIVAAAKSPDPNTSLIDRMLVNAEINGIEPIVCINKTDLADSADLEKIYSDAGYKTAHVSAETGNGVDLLMDLIRGKIAAFAGVSGVGKSSLLSIIIGSSLETGAISEKISRGRHTTRHVELFPIDGGGYVLDTPGFSSVETEDLPLEDVEKCFPEIAAASGECRFRGCAHIGEPDCAVKALVEKGKISESRYSSYKELYELRKGKKEWK